MSDSDSAATVSTPPVFDFFTSVPTPERVALEIRSWGTDQGYQAMFGRLWSEQLGIPFETIAEVARLPEKRFLDRAVSMLEPHLPPLEESLNRIRQAGIRKAVVHAPLPVDVAYGNENTAELVDRSGGTLVGFVRIDPTMGAKAAAEIGRGVDQLGLRGVTITPFWHGVRCTDPELRPLFEAAAERGIPVWLHCSMNWVVKRPLELEHPRHIDELAGRYPDLPIVCGHGGWPWVHDLVAVAWRHPNVFIDTSAFRPKHLFVQGSGWESLAYYGSRTISHKLLWGSTWTLLGRGPDELVAEAWRAPWPESVKQAWLHDNASRLLGI